MNRLSVARSLNVTAAMLTVCLQIAGCGDAHFSGGQRNPVEYENRLAQRQAEDKSAAVAAEEVRQILRLEALPMMTALNELGVRNLQDAAVRVLVAAWLGAKTEEQTLNWGPLDRIDVRFALANELVRAHMNGFSDIPTKSIVEFARPYLAEDRDPGSVARAMYLTILAGTTEDIERVKKVILEQPSQQVFHAGVSALATVCAREAAQALDEIRAHTRDPVDIAILDETRSKSAPFRARRCRGTASHDEAQRS